MSMNELINWVAHNNGLMIQSGFTIILVLIVVYIYRMFFVPEEVETEASAEVALLNQKINQLLEQQTKAALSGQTTTTLDENGEPQDVEKLKSEIFKLRELLNESEKKVFEMAPTGKVDAPSSQAVQAANSASAGESPVSTVVPENSAQVAELSAKIKQLETRLAEYDIIADDIAELSQLRSENSEMKKKLEGLVNNATEKSAVEPVVAAAEVTEISPTEKNLMEDFEKTVQKG